MADTALRDLVVGRLEAGTTAEDSWSTLVLAALDGAKALAGYLDGQAEPRKPAPPETPTEPDREPLGAYLKAIIVEGFRGIGQRRTLELPPGPGLTLVVGRNGSGKSSFAEALELLVTGDTYRWRKPRAQVWREGWRNLHHQTAAIEAELLVEGEKGSTRIATTWKDGADLDEAETYAQVHGKPRMPLAELGWEQALKTYRPFLSYIELGSMLDEGPSKLFDALAAILGLEELTEAQEVLADARKAREKAHKEAAQKRDEILGLLRQMDDDRARTLVAALEKKDWGLPEAETVLAQNATGTGNEADVHVLRLLANLQAPAPDSVATVARELREAQARRKASAGTIAARSKDLAEILDHALRFHQQHGDGDCPVCGRKGALDTKWHEQQVKDVQQLRNAAREATDAHQAGEAARKRALALPSPAGEHLAKAAQFGLDAGAATEALDNWRKGLAESGDLDALAQHLEKVAGPLEAAVAELREKASAELRLREDRWKPIAPALVLWLDHARKAQEGAATVKPLKAAEAWLKNAAAEIRNERFAPIKEKAQQLWSKLRLESNVALRDILLTGSATKRQVDLKVTVDDVEGAALGVMSQGEQNALALSLFIPRATLPESPFRFVVIDDPVQSMDPSRIDGLARVLNETAGKRQVVVFTHDDRLPEAVRRLGIAATVIEVTRREGSAVDLRVAKDPVARSIEDAMALTYTDGLPPDAARRVIPGLCREAVEAACMETVRRRRIGRGQAHAEVEAQLLKAQKLSQLAALALFDDMDRGGEVMNRINRESRSAGDAFVACNGGAHGQFAGVLVDFVRDAEKLARWMQRLP
jgi:recombinational DNA repair ATPase RecF